MLGLFLKPRISFSRFLQVPAAPSLLFVYFLVSVHIHSYLFSNSESTSFLTLNSLRRRLSLLLGIGTAPGIIDGSILDKIQL